MRRQQTAYWFTPFTLACLGHFPLPPPPGVPRGGSPGREMRDWPRSRRGGGGPTAAGDTSGKGAVLGMGAAEEGGGISSIDGSCAVLEAVDVGSQGGEGREAERERVCVCARGAAASPRPCPGPVQAPTASTACPAVVTTPHRHGPESTQNNKHRTGQRLGAPGPCLRYARCALAPGSCRDDGGPPC